VIARDTFLEPMPGDVVDVPNDGTKAEQRGRVWSPDTWQRACSGAEVVVRVP
jgi:hypothetical protein